MLTSHRFLSHLSKVSTSLCIKINQEEYEKGLANCHNALRVRLVLSKGYDPYIAKELTLRIKNIWKTAGKWRMVSLGRGFYDFHFATTEDLWMIWAADTINLKPGVLLL